MKKFLFGFMAVCIAVGLISWGRTGHNVIGRIAANHLTDKAKTDVAAAVAKVEAFDAKQSTWLAAHAHAVVTGALVIAVAYILHVIL